MKQYNAIVKSAMIVFAGIPTNIDETKEILKFMGMYKSKYVSSRVYKYEMAKIPFETIEEFEIRFRRVISNNNKLYREIRRYGELGRNPSLQAEIMIDEFGRGQLIDCWTFLDQIVVLAKSGRSIEFSFCNDEKTVRFVIPASFVKLLAKYKFSFRLVVR